MYKDAERVIQLVNLTVSILSFIGIIYIAYVKGKIRKYYAPAPLIYLLHATVYYISVFTIRSKVGTEIMTLWSAALRLHELITILGAVIIIATSLCSRQKSGE